MPSARPLRTAKAPGKLAPLAVEMRVDPLRLPGRREIERAAERAVGERQPAGEAARIGAQIAAGVRAAGIERGDGDDRRRRCAAAGSARCW